MKPAATLGLFAGVLVVMLGAGYGLGKLTGPSVATAPTHGHEAQPSADGHGGHGDAGPQVRPGGLSATSEGFSLQLKDVRAPRGTAPFRFTVVGSDGAPVTAYEPSHDKELHLIVVRKDLTGFQHLHPVRDARGTWSLPLTLAAGGPYRVYADFVPKGADKAIILASDVTVPGSYQPQPLPAPSQTASVDGYQVEVSGELQAGTASDIELTISRAGKQLTDLEPYLGAHGHLVALREGDLAYLHVHPEDGPAGPTLSFTAEVPSASSYRLFLDFKHDGTVRTAAFTRRAT